MIAVLATFLLQKKKAIVINLNKKPQFFNYGNTIQLPVDYYVVIRDCRSCCFVGNVSLKDCIWPIREFETN